MKRIFSSRIFLTIVSYFQGQSRWMITLWALLVSVLLGFIDYLTGPEISFSIFYIGPIFLAAWFGNRITGSFVAVFAGLAWLIADLSSGSVYSNELIPLWNCLVRLLFFFVIVFLLVIIREQLELEKKRAVTDYLTGLLNSRAFYEMVKTESERAKRYGHVFTLVYLDLDNFKTVNDTFGHDQGDRLLQIVAQTIVSQTRDSDVIGRLGGDEFALLLPETDFEGGEVTIKKLVYHLTDVLKRNNWPVTCSIGAITYLVPDENVTELIKMTDSIMYKVKKSGKNNFLHYEFGRDSESPTRKSL